MKPVLYRFPEWVPLLGEEAITSFSAALLAAFLVAGLLLRRRMRQRGLDAGRGWDVVVCAAVGGLLGAKLLYLLQHALLGGGAGAVTVRSGLVWYGGLLGGAAAVAWCARRWGMPLRPLADAAAPPLALGYAIGRVGSYFVGADYGVPTSSRLGVAFPEGAPPTTPANLWSHFGSSGVTLPGEAFVRVHPTQLYEAAAALGLLGALLWIDRRGARAHDALARPGALMALFLIAAGATRFAVELIRAKDDQLIGWLTLAQVLSIASVVAGALLLRADTAR